VNNKRGGGVWRSMGEKNVQMKKNRPCYSKLKAAAAATTNCPSEIKKM